MRDYSEGIFFQPVEVDAGVTRVLCVGTGGVTVREGAKKSIGK